MLGSDELELENLEEGYESCRRNDIEEDMRIAKTIIQGVAEYTEFKVNFSKKQSWKRLERQLKLDKDLVRLCIMRCFHPDKLMQELRSFIVHFLGKFFVEIPDFKFGEFLDEPVKRQVINKTQRMKDEERRRRRTPTLFMVGTNVNALQEL